MTSHPSHRPVSALRARMIEDMRVRAFTEKTRNDYVRNVRAFAAFLGALPTWQRRRICAASSCTRRRPACSRRASTVRSRPCVSSSPRRSTGLTLPGGSLSCANRAGCRPCWASKRSRCCSRRRRGRSTRRRSPPHTALDCASPRSSRSRSAISIPSACCCGSSRARAARACPRESGGPQRHVVAATARAAARLVAGGPAPGRVAAAGLAVSGPQSRPAALDPPAQPRRPCRCRGRRDQEASVAAHTAAQLCHASAGTGHRHPRHPGVARSRDILPTNTRSRGGFTIRFIPGAARPCSLPGNMPTVMLNWSLFRSPTGRSPASPRG